MCNWLNRRTARTLARLFLDHLAETREALALDQAQVRLLCWMVLRALSSLSPAWVEKDGLAFIQEIRRFYD